MKHVNNLTKVRKRDVVESIHGHCRPPGARATANDPRSIPFLTGLPTRRSVEDVLEYSTMMMTIPKSARPRTFLSPGQRFQPADVFTGGDNAELVVSRLVRDPLGLLHVVLRAQDGREISAYVEQIEAAISEGHLAPIAPSEAVMISA
jgi:hypothetical protein